jgi:hypothetical protein
MWFLAFLRQLSHPEMDPSRLNDIRKDIRKSLFSKNLSVCGCGFIFWIFRILIIFMGSFKEFLTNNLLRVTDGSEHGLAKPENWLL